MSRSKDGMDGLRHTDIYGFATEIMKLCCSENAAEAHKKLRELLQDFSVSCTQNDRLDASHLAATFAKEMEMRANYATYIGKNFRHMPEHDASGGQS